MSQWSDFLFELSPQEALWPDDSWGRCRTLAVAVVTILVAKKIYDKYGPSNRDKFTASRFTSRSGVLVLHQFSRGKFCPNLSPFALKLECYLRLAGIEYEVDSKVPFGPKSKCPWVNLENGQPMGDSQFIISALKEQETGEGGRGRVPRADQNLTPRERGALEGIRILVDEQLFWCVIYWRYYLDNFRAFLTTQKFPLFLHYAFPLFMSRGIKRKAVMQGIGVHTPDEVHVIARQCCQALDDYLGDNAFFCGESPGTVDCSVFGGLAQIMWNAPGTHYEALMTESFPRLSAYCNRMKEELFPDWDDLLLERWSG